MGKPITVVRHEFTLAMIETANSFALPAFVKIEVMEKLIRELREIEAKELNRDMAMVKENADAPEVT